MKIVSLAALLPVVSARRPTFKICMKNYNDDASTFDKNQISIRLGYSLNGGFTTGTKTFSSTAFGSSSWNSKPLAPGDMNCDMEVDDFSLKSDTYQWLNVSIGFNDNKQKPSALLPKFVQTGTAPPGPVWSTPKCDPKWGPTYGAPVGFCVPAPPETPWKYYEENLFDLAQLSSPQDLSSRTYYLTPKGLKFENPVKEPPTDSDPDDFFSLVNDAPPKWTDVRTYKNHLQDPGCYVSFSGPPSPAFAFQDHDGNGAAGAYGVVVERAALTTGTVPANDDSTMCSQPTATDCWSTGKVFSSPAGGSFNDPASELDKFPTASNFCYRIKAVDQYGAFTYSNVSVNSYQPDTIVCCDYQPTNPTSSPTASPTSSPTTSPTDVVTVAPTDECHPDHCEEWNCEEWCQCFDENAEYPKCEDDEDTCSCGEREATTPILAEGTSIGCYHFDEALTNSDYGILSVDSAWDGYRWAACKADAIQKGAYYFGLGLTGSPRHGGQPSGGKNACVIFDNNSGNLFNELYKPNPSARECCTKLDVSNQFHKFGHGHQPVCLGGWPGFVVYATGLGSVAAQPAVLDDPFVSFGCAPNAFNAPPQC